MPKVVKQELKSETFLSIDELFTDRQEARDLFWRVYGDMTPEEYQVVHFYGIGGMGKTILLGKICREIEEKVPQKGRLDHAFFSFEGHASKDEFLFSLSRQMMLCNRGLKFPLFDAAIKRLWMEENHDLTKLEQRTRSIFLENPFFQGMVDGVKDSVPLQDFVGSVAGGVLESTMEKGAVKVIEQIVKVTGEKIAEKEQLEGPNAALYQEIKVSSGKALRNNLHFYFLKDVQETFEKRTRPYVVCIDGYEKYVNQIKDGELAHYMDDWFCDMETGLVNIANVIWVISGRERLHWSQELLPEDQVLKIEDMGEEDCASYFNKAGVADEKLAGQLWTLCNGTPVYMDLCVKTYRALKKNREPVIEDFGTNITELVKRYFEEMDDADRRVMVMLASLPNSWEKELVKEVAIRIHYDMYLPKLDNLLGLSVFSQIGTDYKMHETVRQAVKSVYGQEVSRIQEEVFLMIAEDLLDMEDETPKPKKWTQFFDLLPQIDKALLEDMQMRFVAAQISNEIELTGEYLGRMYQLEMLCKYVQEQEYDEETVVACQIKRNDNLYRLGFSQQSMELAKETYEYAREKLGEENFYTRMAMLGYATTALSVPGNKEKAKECYEWLYDYGKTHDDMDGMDFIVVLDGLGLICMDDEDYEKAAEYTEECSTYCQKELGPAHPKTLMMRRQLAMINIMRGKAQEEFSTFLELCDIAKKNLGKEHVVTLTIVCDMMEMMLLYKHSDSVIPTCKFGFQATLKNLGPHHELTKRYAKLLKEALQGDKA